MIVGILADCEIQIFYNENCFSGGFATKKLLFSRDLHGSHAEGSVKIENFDFNSGDKRANSIVKRSFTIVYSRHI